MWFMSSSSLTNVVLGLNGPCCFVCLFFCFPFFLSSCRGCSRTSSRQIRPQQPPLKTTYQNSLRSHWPSSTHTVHTLKRKAHQLRYWHSSHLHNCLINTSGWHFNQRHNGPCFPKFYTKLFDGCSRLCIFVPFVQHHLISPCYMDFIGVI